MILKTPKMNGQFLNSYSINRVLGYLQSSLQHSRGLLVVLFWRVCKIWKKSPLLVKTLMDTKIFVIMYKKYDVLKYLPIKVALKSVHLFIF